MTLFVLAAIVGAALLDTVAYRWQTAEFNRIIDRKFIEQSLRVGAWAMDRKTVTDKIGMDEADLPSYKRDQEQK